MVSHREEFPQMKADGALPRALKKALEDCALMGFKSKEACLVTVYPIDLDAAKAACMGTAYSKPQLDKPDMTGNPPTSTPKDSYG